MLEVSVVVVPSPKFQLYVIFVVGVEELLKIVVEPKQAGGAEKTRQEIYLPKQY